MLYHQTNYGITTLLHFQNSNSHSRSLPKLLHNRFPVVNQNRLRASSKPDLVRHHCPYSLTLSRTPCGSRKFSLIPPRSLIAVISSGRARSSSLFSSSAATSSSNRRYARNPQSDPKLSRATWTPGRRVESCWSESLRVAPYTLGPPPPSSCPYASVELPYTRVSLLPRANIHTYVRIYNAVAAAAERASRTNSLSRARVSLAISESEVWISHRFATMHVALSAYWQSLTACAVITYPRIYIYIYIYIYTHTYLSLV